MFPAWRLRLREAKHALDRGRLDDAGQLLSRDSLRQFLPAQKLADRAARQLAVRAQDRVQQGRSGAGWNDLHAAERLRGPDAELDAIRQRMVIQALDEARGLLESGAVGDALQALDRLLHRGVSDRSVRRLRHLAGRLREADKLAREGKFAAAEACLSRSEAMADDEEMIRERLAACRLNGSEHRRRTVALHRALADGSWSEVLAAALAVLEVAPADRSADIARRRAWRAVGAASCGGPVAVGHDDDLLGEQPASRTAVSTDACLGSAKVDTVTETRSRQRFVVWIDAVGGYLVCLDNRIVLGQGGSDHGVDVPILGDLSRRHAAILREGEGYLLDPMHAVRVNGREVTQVVLLRDGDELELGSVKLRFRKPHPLSATARLDLASRHKTQPSADGILLMADTCIFGPSMDSHVLCRGWPHDVVLYRHDTSLFCRMAGTFDVDGTPVDGQGRLSDYSQVVGDAFSFSLEPFIQT